MHSLDLSTSSETLSSGSNERNAKGAKLTYEKPSWYCNDCILIGRRLGGVTVIDDTARIEKEREQTIKEIKETIELSEKSLLENGGATSLAYSGPTTDDAATTLRELYRCAPPAERLKKNVAFHLNLQRDLLDTVCSWCKRKGIEEFRNIWEADMESEFVDALNLNLDDARALRKRIDECHYQRNHRDE